MRILYVWDAEYPWDVRTEKICLALARHGHDVVITGRNTQGRPRSERLAEGMVERLPPLRGRAGRLLSFPAFFNPLWIAHLSRLVRTRGVDLIMVRDLPLAPTALHASGGRIPVILDMAENYPAMIADIWADGRPRLLDVLVRNPSVVAAVERYTVRRVTHTLTVVEESSDRLARLGVPTSRTTVVSNTPSTSRIVPLVPRRAEEPLRMVYLGLMEKHRGIADLLLAAQMLAAARTPFRLDFVGDGRDYGRFRDHAAQLGLSGEEVLFHGRLPHAEAIAVLGRAHVGIVPHQATDSWNSTIPNKLFDYMAAGLAVVSSDAAPAARVTLETGAGLVYRSGDGVGLAKAIRRFLDLGFWDQCRRAGQEAIRSRYNWEYDTRTLLTVVEEVRSHDRSRES
jgi:glycosyltransferase involved in cell wall biosynthesis